MATKVYLVKVREDTILQSVAKLIRKIAVPCEYDKIGVKINLADYRRRETGVTTDPFVLDPLLKTVRNLYPGSNLYLFENDATGTIADNLYKWLGLDRIGKKYDATFINLARQEWTKVRIDGCHFKALDVPTLLNSSMIINHAKLKTHGRTKISCGLKNMFGCYRIKKKEIYHSILDKAIVDINIALRSHVTIVDGYIGVEGNRGPTQGFPKKAGVLIGGNDVVAVDALCARLMGFNHRLIGHIVRAEKKGIGTTKYQVESEIPESEFRRYKFEFSLPKYWLMQAMRHILR